MLISCSLAALPSIPVALLNCTKCLWWTVWMTHLALCLIHLLLNHFSRCSADSYHDFYTFLALYQRLNEVIACTCYVMQCLQKLKWAGDWGVHAQWNISRIFHAYAYSTMLCIYYEDIVYMMDVTYIYLVSHAIPLNRKERGVWWPCVQRVVLATKSGRVQSDSRFEFIIAKQRLACGACMYGWPCYFCGCLWCLLQLLHSTRTTRCTHGHLIPLSLLIEGSGGRHNIYCGTLEPFMLGSLRLPSITRGTLHIMCLYIARNAP